VKSLILEDKTKKKSYRPVLDGFVSICTSDILREFVMNTYIYIDMLVYIYVYMCMYRYIYIGMYNE